MLTSVNKCDKYVIKNIRGFGTRGSLKAGGYNLFNDIIYILQIGSGCMVGVERFPTIRKYEPILDQSLFGITTIIVIHAQTV